LLEEKYFQNRFAIMYFEMNHLTILEYKIGSTLYLADRKIFRQSPIYFKDLADSVADKIAKLCFMLDLPIVSESYHNLLSDLSVQIFDDAKIHGDGINKKFFSDVINILVKQKNDAIKNDVNSGTKNDRSIVNQEKKKSFLSYLDGLGCNPYATKKLYIDFGFCDHSSIFINSNQDYVHYFESSELSKLRGDMEGIYVNTENDHIYLTSTGEKLEIHLEEIKCVLCLKDMDKFTQDYPKLRKCFCLFGDYINRIFYIKNFWGLKVQEILVDANY